MRTAHRVRLAAILAVGAFALHQLRFLIAFGDSSSAELAQQGHRYMSELAGADRGPGPGGRPRHVASRDRRGLTDKSAARAAYCRLHRGAAVHLRGAGVPRGNTRRRAPGGPRRVVRPRWLDRAPARGGDRRPVGAARALPRESRARYRGGPRDAASARPCSRESRAGPSGSGTEPAFSAPRLRPRQEAASAGTCLVRCQSARVVPSFRERRQRAVTKEVLPDAIQGCTARPDRGGGRRGDRGLRRAQEATTATRARTPPRASRC